MPLLESLKTLANYTSRFHLNVQLWYTKGGSAKEPYNENHGQ